MPSVARIQDAEREERGLRTKPPRRQVLGVLAAASVVVFGFVAVLAWIVAVYLGARALLGLVFAWL